MASIDDGHQPVCPLCGQVEDTIVQGLWRCPKVIAKGRLIRTQQEEARIEEQMERLLPSHGLAGGPAASAPGPLDHHTRFPQAAVRGHYPWFDVEPADLPIPLLHGLPPAMGTDLLSTFWQTPAAQVQTTTPGARALLGISNHSPKQLEEATRQHTDTQKYLSQRNLQHLPARQAFAHLRGPFQPPAHIAPP